MNRVTDAAAHGSGALCSGGTTTFLHNTFAGNTGGTCSAVELVSSLTGPATATALNTIVSDHDVGYLVAAGSTLSFDYALWHDTVWDYGGAGTVSFGTHLFHGDPLFRDAPGLDFHITSGSAARDMGGDAGIDHDFEDQLRPWDSGYDIGADEYHYTPARGVRIECPLSIHPGGEFFVHGFLINDLALQPDMAVFFLLDIGGDYWFWPSWSHYSAADPSSIDFEIRDVASGETRVYVLNPFTWPDTGGAAMAGLRFWGAIVDPASNTLFGELAAVSWAFGP